MKDTENKRRTAQSCLNEMRIRIPSLSVNEGVARAVIAAFCAQLDPSAMEIADIKCAVSEAVTNCIVHAYKDSIGVIYITAKLLEGRVVRVEIRDKGCGIEDVREARQPLFTTDAANERSGMGFTIMESFMTNLEITSQPGKGTSVHMRRKLQRRQ